MTSLLKNTVIVDLKAPILDVYYKKAASNDNVKKKERNGTVGLSLG